MELIEVRIHNFRGIIDQTFRVSRYSLLVGPNNAGKSTIIDALRTFYEKDGAKFKPSQDFPFTGNTDKESWIELSFMLSPSEYESLADEYKSSDRRLRVRKFLQTVTKTHDNKNASGQIFGYRGDGKLSNEPFYGAKNVQLGKFGDVIYIPAISKVDEHAKLSGPSALRDLLTAILSAVVDEGQAYKDFAASVETFSKTIRDESTADNRSLAGFQADLNALLNPWGASFDVHIPPPSASDIIRSMVSWKITDNTYGKSQDIDYFGSGFQRHFIYSLIQISSRYARKSSSSKAKDFSPEFNLILFEEPEAFLHPQQQEELARNLMALAQEDSWQVICTSHSAHFVSKRTDDIPAISRVHRRNGIVTIHQITPEDWNAIVDANQVIAKIAEKYPDMARKMHEDDMRPEMESVKHFLWLNSDRSSLFFANHVLLVEGPSEVAFINRLTGDGLLPALPGLFVLDCLGKYNIHRFMNMLGSLGIPHSVLHDSDNNKGEHKDINQLIRESKNNFTLEVREVPGDLETYLSIPKPGSNHRKPQHLLFLYNTGAIPVPKLTAFCELVRAILPGASEVSSSKQVAAGLDE